MKRYFIETWGCQMNVHDSEKLAGLLIGLGYERAEGPDDSDLVLLNTCSVREKAAAKVFARLGALRRIKQRRPGMLIGVCGCVAQQEGEAVFRRAPYVDLVMGPRTLARLPEILEEAQRDGRSISLARDDEPVAFPSGLAARRTGPRAYVTVMEGCNKTCTYCIVPFTRGREVYRRAEEIVAEAQALAAGGHVEIELLGQNVNAWRRGQDDLASLLYMIDRIPGVRRQRFTTSHPGHLRPRIMDAMRDLPTVCKHLHLPVQSGSDRMLAAMNRGYTRAKFLGKIDYLRRAVPGMAFSTDVIVGFPGETEIDFQETLALVREVEFDQIYAFSFSPRPGTAACDLAGSLPEGEKKRRLQELFIIQEEIIGRRNAALVGRRFEVLVDGPTRLDAAVFKGRTTCNRIVHLEPCPADVRPGDFLQVRITRAHAHSLSGAVEARAGAA